MNEKDLPSSNSGNKIVELVCWGWIGALVAGLMALNFFAPQPENTDDEGPSMEIVQLELLGKTAMIGESLQPEAPQTASPAENLNQGSVEMRLCAVLLQLEIRGPEAAKDLLNAVKETIELRGYVPNETQQRLLGIVAAIIDSRAQVEFWDSSVIASEDQQFLTKRLGWFGKLGLTPENSADVTLRDEMKNEAWQGFWGAILVGIGILGLGFIGLVMFVVALMLFKNGTWVWQCPRNLSSGTIYLETFAVWLTVFIGFQMALGALPIDPNWALPLNVAVFFFSLIALVWPMWRGRSFGEIRQDIGWIAPRPVHHFFAGFTSYLAMLPILVLSLIVTVTIAGILTSFSETEELAGAPMPGGHPIVEMVAQGDLWTIGWVFMAAVVGAPIVEETVFRGVLFRHLQDKMSRATTVMAFLFSAFVNSFIFAAIHPQGLVGIPMLMMLAVGFSLSRQWQNSLMPAMLLHAIHNFGLLTITYLWLG